MFLVNHLTATMPLVIKKRRRTYNCNSLLWRRFFQFCSAVFRLFCFFAFIYPFVVFFWIHCFLQTSSFRAFTFVYLYSFLFVSLFIYVYIWLIFTFIYTCVYLLMFWYKLQIILYWLTSKVTWKISSALEVD